MTAPPVASSAEALADRLFESAVGALELLSVHLGMRLGFYDALEASGPLTAAGLAAAAGADERYAREWLEQQAVAGLLTVDDVHAPADARAYAMPDGHAAVLTAREDPAFAAPLAPMVVGIAGVMPEVVEAYRTGAGVPYPHYGPDFRAGQGAINVPTFVHDLPGWLAAAPGVDDRLRAGPPARVADVGCGLGGSTAAMARAYPEAEVVGIDSDPASVEEARAAHPGVAFEVADAAGLGGPWDLVTIFEALHDMARPVEALAAARGALAPGGCVLVADERVADEFTAPGDLVERVMYGWSVTHCLPSSRAEQPSAALGTALRASTVHELAAQAGFATTEELPIEHDFFRVYRLAP